MGKKSRKKDVGKEEREPLFVAAADEDGDASASANGGGPPPATITPYRDDPQASDGDGGGGSASPKNPTTGGGGGGPAPSIFDWDDGIGGGGGVGGGTDGAEKMEVAGAAADDDDAYRIDDLFDPDSNGFSPVSLHDDDSDDDDDNNEDEDGDEERGGLINGASSETKDAERIRIKANSLLNQSVSFDEEEDDRIFVGGGWGRHGSSRGVCSFRCCCCKGTEDDHRPKKDPAMKRRGSLGWTICAGITFLALVVGSGYVGYEAGLPADDDVGGGADAGPEDGGDDAVVVHHPHTKGDEWLEWLEHEIVHEKDNFHGARWQFHHPKPHDKGEGGGDVGGGVEGVDAKAGAEQQQPHYAPRTQVELLHISENVFQSCSERSLATVMGRNACLSLCRGRYCCFEREEAYGSCVQERYSYCFAYAACENAIADFDMNNANTNAVAAVGAREKKDDVVFNTLDTKLLSETCSRDNIATLDGIRDCTAFCEHHMCCFTELENWGCRGDRVGECEAYDACRMLEEALERQDGTGIGGGTGNGNAAAGSDGDDSGPSSNVVVDKDIETAVHAVCSLGDVLPDGNDSWVKPCHALCADYLCCFSPDESNCRGAYGDDLCNAYQGCVVLHASSADAASGAEISGGKGNANAVVEEKPTGQGHESQYGMLDAAGYNRLSETCSPGNIATLDGIRDCTGFCEHHMCCFTESDEWSCRGDRAGECQAYDACKVLVGVQNEDGAFAADCMQNNLDDNWDLCGQHCAEYECCFGMEDSCYFEKKLECDYYHVCENFFLDDGQGGAKKVDGQRQQGSGKGPAGGGGSRPSGDMDIDTAIHAVCSLGDMLPDGDDSWVTACHALCASHLCCFSSGESNCSGDYGDGLCDLYQGCSVLHGSAADNTPSGTGNSQEVDAVNEACVSKARRDPWLSEKCRKACDSRDCCFSPDPLYNCVKGREEWCEEFQACEVLYI